MKKDTFVRPILLGITLVLSLMLIGCLTLFEPRSQEIFVPCLILTDHVGETFIFNEAEDLTSSGIQQSSAGRCHNRTLERMFPGIDFNYMSVIGHVTKTAGCKVDTRGSLRWDHERQEVTYTVHSYAEGNCSVNFIYGNWILTEKIPPSYTVQIVEK